ncbi:MAG: PfkB domain protein [Armatimonadetes bacterium]|jgi:sugar/nucleoside kinase (ribokinase family)|nr:PfkB domain protein [Armatimonadota bacterium]
MKPGNEVVCAGILVADHVCTPMDRLPSEGHLVAVDGMFLLTGGCAANVAVNVAKQGVGVQVMGKVGDDYWGRFVREDLARRGVATESILVSETQQTSQTMILLCKGEDRRFVHTFGANRDFRARDIDKSLLQGASVFYLGGYLVMPDLLPDDLAALFRYCREQGIRTVLDVVIPTGYTYNGELEPVLPHTDVFLPNNDEAEMLTGESDPLRQAESLRGRGARTVVVTMGGDGLLFAEGQQVWQARHFPSNVVDQTGAGDAFCAGFIAGMVRGQDLAGCIHYGSALGASCVRSIGCYEGVFLEDQAAEFLAENRLEIEQIR